ncbi:Biotin synthase [Triticum urartu]|uniref:Biotin synthase n=1 Tax=Triticum urartu TaxID=4572 RepID=M7ZEU0_TRIUA|nr:Biotin synthase [Triticum urartu]
MTQYIFLSRHRTAVPLSPFLAISFKISFPSLAEVFCNSRDSSAAADLYSTYISQQLSEYSVSSNTEHIAALIIEPGNHAVIQGAGGMHMIDPLFQRVLVHECRDRKIPVIFDEVFTGFWRLGVESASELLGCLPDVACYAKLMTGGIVPLAATVTTEAVFEAFKSDSKLTALLHGHSYTAHAMGCSAAVKAIQWFRDPSTNSNLDFDRMKLKEGPVPQVPDSDILPLQSGPDPWIPRGYSSLGAVDPAGSNLQPDRPSPARSWPSTGPNCSLLRSSSPAPRSPGRSDSSRPDLPLPLLVLQAGSLPGRIAPSWPDPSRPDPVWTQIRAGLISWLQSTQLLPALDPAVLQPPTVSCPFIDLC